MGPVVGGGVPQLNLGLQIFAEHSAPYSELEAWNVGGPALLLPVRRAGLASPALMGRGVTRGYMVPWE